LALDFNGTNTWELNLGTSTRSSPTIAPDGTVYVGGDDGKVRSIFGSGALAASAWPMFQHDIRHTGRSTNAIGPPGVPAPVTATDVSFNDRVRVSGPSVSNALYYEVWRVTTTNLNDTVRLAPQVTATNSFDDRTAIEGVSYFYFVRAGNSSGFGEFSQPDRGFRRIAVTGEIVGELRSRGDWGFAGAVALGRNGLLCVGGYDGRLYGLNPDLTPQWYFEFGTFGAFSTPAIAPDG